MAKKQRGRAELTMERAREVLDRKLKAANKGGKAADSKRNRAGGAAGGAAGSAKKTRVRSDKMASKKNSKKPEA